jgi:hypothetical protein
VPFLLSPATRQDAPFAHSLFALLTNDKLLPSDRLVNAIPSDGTSQAYYC